MPMRKQRGLTLVELMVVVAVMAIIAAVAYPLYTAQAQKSRRADAKIALETVAMAQERYYTLNGQYAATLGSLQVSGDIQGGTSDEGYYSVAVAVGGTNSEQFTATAAALSGNAQSGDSACQTFTLNQLGTKTPATGCW